MLNVCITLPRSDGNIDFHASDVVTCTGGYNMYTCQFEATNSVINNLLHGIKKMSDYI